MNIELSEHEIKLMLSAITAKQKRLRGSIRNNIKSLNTDKNTDIIRMISVREKQMKEYRDLKLNLQVLINNEDEI